MYTVFLSPSTQEFNPYVTVGNEELWMNRVADAMEPYLRSTGISYVRNDPSKPVSASIAQSNAGQYDVHLALHSNAAGAANAGQVRGTDAYYYPGSANGQRLADIIVDNFKRIYPLPDLVRAVPTTRLAEVSRTRAPTVLLEVAYHDNVDDANWITTNIDRIARNLVQSLAQYFGIPFIDTVPPRQGRVRTMGGALNVRNKPSTEGAVIGQIPNGSIVTIQGRTGDWYVVTYNGLTGYAAVRYVVG